MSEKLEIYDLEENLIEIKKRTEFYEEIKKEYASKGIISKQVKRIVLFLLNSEGKIVIQKRNNLKNDNAGLFDKTIGGHVEEGDSYELTLVKECSEELGFPVSLLPKKDFVRGLKKTNLRVVGIFKELNYQSNVISTRITKRNKEFKQPYMQMVYVGYYDGPIQFIDGESSGIQLFTRDELEKEISLKPEIFTKDLITMFELYKDFLIPVEDIS